jgi:hypothetical protein
VGFDRFVKSAAGFVNANEDELLEQWSHMMQSPQPTEIAHRVKAPAVMIVGSRDRNVLQSDAEALRKAYGGPTEFLDVPLNHDFDGAQISIANAIKQLFERLPATEEHRS